MLPVCVWAWVTAAAWPVFNYNMRGVLGAVWDRHVTLVNHGANNKKDSKFKKWNEIRLKISSLGNSFPRPVFTSPESSVLYIISRDAVWAVPIEIPLWSCFVFGTTPPSSSFWLFCRDSVETPLRFVLFVLGLYRVSVSCAAFMWSSGPCFWGYLSDFVAFKS